MGTQLVVVRLNVVIARRSFVQNANLDHMDLDLFVQMAWSNLNLSECNFLQRNVLGVMFGSSRMEDALTCIAIDVILDFVGITFLSLDKSLLYSLMNILELLKRCNDPSTLTGK